MNALTLIPLAAGLAAVVALHHFHMAKRIHSARAFLLRLVTFAMVYAVAYQIASAFQ